jgi:MYXO-CTERM domain-containing protein
MARRNVYRDFVSLAVGAIALSLGVLARADIPAGYAGKPFDPAVAGGPKCPATVKAGPYTIPGRLDFVNYDMGGDGIAYHTGDHLTKGGTGYRIDMPTATLSWTADCIPNGGPPTCTNVWYDTSATLDGTPYPSATTSDFTIGSVQDGDWFNFTVNVETTGTYSLSSTWASGNGPPGGEGGNGDMGLEVFSNGTKLATWTAVFPDYNTEADFHHWVAYPNFATVTLTAGPQVIKLQSGAKHLQLDYVEFTLGASDGGTEPEADSAASGSGAGSGTSSGSVASTGSAASGVASGTSSGTTGPSSGTVATTGGGTTSGTTTGGSAGAGSGTIVGTSGVGASGSSSGTVGPTGTGTGTGSNSVGATAPTQSSSKGCSVSAAPMRSAVGGSFLLVLGGALLARRRKAHARWARPRDR